MASQFALDQGGVGRDEYATLLAEMMKRYGGNRDQAVRSANVAGGFGNSTAQRFMGGGAGAPAPADVPLPQARPAGGGGGGGEGPVPVPAERPTRSPTSEPNSPSPMRDPSLMWQGATGGGGSPPRDPSLMWPGATGGRVGQRVGGGVPQNAQNGQAISRVSSDSVPPELLQLIMQAFA